MGPGGFFPTNLDLADILGRTDFDFERKKIGIFWLPAWARLGPRLGPGLGPGLGLAWARLGPGLGPAWARLGPALGPGLGPKRLETVRNGF